MISLHVDPEFTFRFADDRIIPRFHLEGVVVGVEVLIQRKNFDTGGTSEITLARVGEGGWVDLTEPLVVRAGSGFVVRVR